MLFSPSGVSAGFRLVGRHCLSLEGLLGDRRGKLCGLAALEACELLSTHIDAYPGAMTLARMEDCL